MKGKLTAAKASSKAKLSVFLRPLCAFLKQEENFQLMHNSS